MQRSKSTLAKTLLFIRESGREAERRALMSRSKNRGISVTSKEKKERESVRSGSKIRLFNPANRGSGSKVTVMHETTRTEEDITGRSTERHIRTIACLSESVQYSKRLGTENSPAVRKGGAICSVFFESRFPEGRLQQNKENIKPSLNMLRRNRFR